MKIDPNELLRRWELSQKECIVCHIKTAVGMGTPNGFVCMYCYNRMKDLEIKS
jgi:hypothetical protein